VAEWRSNVTDVTYFDNKLFIDCYLYDFH
jgi:hypothetical protein